AEVAVGDEGVHPARLGERERVTVVTVSVLRRAAASGDLAEEPEGPRLVAALTALAGKGEGSPGECESVLEPVGEDVRLGQIHQEARLVTSKSRRLTGAQRVRRADLFLLLGDVQRSLAFRLARSLTSRSH